MSLLHTTLHENRRTVALALPIMAGHLSQMLMGWADTVMIGQVGVLPLAACSLANSLLMVFMLFGFGLLSSVAVFVAESFGGGQNTRAGEFFYAGLVLAFFVGLLMAGFVILFLPALHYLGQPEDTVLAAKPYLIFLACSLSPLFLASAAKSYSEALSKPWIPFWIIFFSVWLNVFLNWLLIFGNWGFPELGLSGAGIATLAARIVGAIILLTVIFKSRIYKCYRPIRLFGLYFKNHLRCLFRIGLPAGTQIVMEVGAFALASVMMGWIGVKAMASHQVAITCAATTFMVPLGMAIALTVRLGQTVGKKKFEKLRPIALGALVTGLFCGGIFALLLAFFARPLGALFISDPEVLPIITSLLGVAAFFQIFDATQVIAVGGLRGLSDVRVPMFIIIISYWGVGLPLAALLAFSLNMGALGIWLGLAFSLLLVSIIANVRLWWKCGAYIIPTLQTHAPK
ncbi:MAG: MATE family efflux transporter [Chthoniobacterales bacterium]